MISTLALVAAGFWVVLPAAVALSANAAQSESEPCSCCHDQPALGGIVACPGCQVGAIAESALPVSPVTYAAAWFDVLSVRTSGIDPAPAEPPPR
jgi:hypothetical protein